MKHELDVKVERIGVDKLIPYANNAKIHTCKNVDAIQTSINSFGFVQPIIAWHNAEGGAEIVSGHGRIQAAKKEGLETVPVIFVDALTDKERRALMIADNQTTMMTGWDTDLLSVELDDLASDFAMDDFGFDDFQLSTQEQTQAAQGAKEIDLDSFDGFAHKCPRCGFEYDD